MSKPAGKTDDLLDTSPKGVIELNEAALDSVAGGETAVVKAKTADKAFKAVDAYIRG